MYLPYAQKLHARMHQHLEYGQVYPHKQWWYSHEVKVRKQYTNVRPPSPHPNLPSRHLRDQYCRLLSYCTLKQQHVHHCPGQHL